jgi:hypothetical protein
MEIAESGLTASETVAAAVAPSTALGTVVAHAKKIKIAISAIILEADFFIAKHIVAGKSLPVQGDHLF